jgi:magnesium transporter
MCCACSVNDSICIRFALEDVLETWQRPKAEQYDDYLFIVGQMLYLDAEKQMCGEQVSMFLGKRFLITLQEEADFDVFDPVRARIRSSSGRIRKAGLDYLAYALLDSIVDHYYPVLESIGSAIEDIEDEQVENPMKRSVRSLHQYKRTLTQIRRYVNGRRAAVKHAGAVSSTGIYRLPSFDARGRDFPNRLL